MTVGTDVKGCYFSVKSAEAQLAQLAIKTNNLESERTFKEAEKILSEVREDLKKQIQFLAREEPQYK